MIGGHDFLHYARPFIPMEVSVMKNLYVLLGIIKTAQKTVEQMPISDPIARELIIDLERIEARITTRILQNEREENLAERTKDHAS